MAAKRIIVLVVMLMKKVFLMLPSSITLEKAPFDIVLLLGIAGAEIEVQLCANGEVKPPFVDLPVRAFHGNYSIFGYEKTDNEALKITEKDESLGSFRWCGGFNDSILHEKDK